jgi:predicted kinase
MVRPRLHLLCGPSLAGKSTLASELASRGVVVISLDALNAAHERAAADGSFAVESWVRSHQRAQELTRRALAAGADVALDDTLCFRFLRDDYRRLAAEVGAEAVLWFLNVPAAELWRRREAALASGSRAVLSAAALAEHLRTFEPPAADEDPVRVEDGRWAV